MTDKFIPIDDFANFEKISYESLRKRIIRDSENYKTKTEPNENGGRDKVFVAVSSLSKAAQRRYRVSIAKKRTNTDDIPWYVYCDLNWYIEKYTQNYYEAVELSRYVGKYADGKNKMSAKDFESYMSEKFNISERSVRRYVKDYIEASAWAADEELKTGEDYSYFKILAMARKPKPDKTFPSINEEMAVFIENTYYDDTFALNNNPVTNLYEDLEELSFEKDWKMPSYNTVLRYIEYIKAQDGEGARDLSSKGLRYWKNRYMMKRYRDTGALQVLEIVQGDVHTFDFWASIKRANGKLDAVRPALVAWIDMRSRALVGWVITECPDADIMKQSIINVIYPKANKALPYGVPKYLLIDNGKEYTAQCLTGRPRTERVCFDEEAKGFYRSMGILDDIRSLPFQPWSKAQIERYFRTVELKFGKRIKSYTGTLTGSKTSDKINRDINKMLENGELPTIEEIAEQFENWVVNKFHCKKHRGLINQGEDSPAPIDVFNKADAYFKPASPIDYAVSLLMKGETRLVSNMGIKRTVKGKPVWYTNQELAKYQGRKVQFKYFPNDITKVLVYDEDGKRICEAVSYELLHIAPKLSEAALIEHIKDQKRQQRETRETIKYRKASFEERQELNLMDAGKKVIAPAVDTADMKVTAMVDDKRYREDKLADKYEAENNITHEDVKSISREMPNEYLKRKADEAFARLG